jgi:Flp pilus assembly protein TadB
MSQSIDRSGRWTDIEFQAFLHRFAMRGSSMIKSDPFAQIDFNARRRSGGLLSPIVWLGGLIATALAVTVGAVLAVVTAAAVALIALVAGVVVFLASFAFRARRARSARARQDEGVIDAQKVGDTWVAYGWEREGR